MRLLTTSEAAQYLRLKERKIYEMVAEGAIPCTKITGRWLAASVARPAGMPRSSPAGIIGGSHDPLLEWALRESRCGLASLAEGSGAGIERFSKGEIIASAIHLHALDDAEADANVAMMQARGDMQDAVLIGFCRREQGFLVAPGNPLKIDSIADVLTKGARMAQRPKGAGAQLLLLALLQRAKVTPDKLAAGPMCPTGPDVAQAIRAERADAGIATRSVAAAVGLDFVPILWEPFDLLMRQRDYFYEPVQMLVQFLRSAEFRTRANELGGFDVSLAGTVRFVN